MTVVKHGVGGDRGQGRGSKKGCQAWIGAQAWDGALGAQVGPFLSINILEYQPSSLGATSLQGLIPWDTIKYPHKGQSLLSQCPAF